MQTIMWRCVQPCRAEFPNPVDLAAHRSAEHPDDVAAGQRARVAYDAVLAETQDYEMAEAAFALALTDSIAFVVPNDDDAGDPDDYSWHSTFDTVALMSIPTCTSCGKPLDEKHQETD